MTESKSLCRLPYHSFGGGRGEKMLGLAIFSINYFAATIKIVPTFGIYLFSSFVHN